MDFAKLLMFPIIDVLSSNSTILPSSIILPLMNAETLPCEGIPGAYSVTSTLLYSSVPSSADAEINRPPIWVVMEPTLSYMLLPVSTLLQNDSSDAPEARRNHPGNSIPKYRAINIEGIPFPFYLVILCFY